MMGECPQMKELVDKGIVLRDPTSRKFYMANGTEIIRNRGETLAQSATRQQQSYIPSTNWVTIADEGVLYSPPGIPAGIQSIPGILQN
jgi:hypothetical protein